MRFSHRFKSGSFSPFIVLIALVSAIVFYGAAPAPSNSAITATHTYKAMKGTISKVAVVDPKQLSGIGTAPVSNSVRVMRHPLVRKIAGTSSTAARPFAPATALSKSKGALLQNFNGVSSVDNFKVNGFHLEPPDEGLAVGNGFVMNIVNLAATIYRPNGTVITGPFGLAPFFGESNAFNLSDPRAYYDKTTNTWFALIWEADFTNFTESHIDLAVNPSGDPTTAWTIFRIDTTDAGANGEPNDPGCPCLPDYTIFGLDQYNVYLSSNEFDLATETIFNGAQVYAVSKSQLVSLASTVNFVHFGNLSVAGTIAYHLQPATTDQQPNAEYFLNSLDPNSTFDNRVGVWAMTNRQSVTSGNGTPNLTNTVVTTEPYGFPVPALTPVGFNTRYNQSTSGFLNPDFDAMFEVQYINGNLWSSLDTALTIPGDTAERDAAAWFEIRPSLSAGAIGSAHVVKQGYVASQGNYLLYPEVKQSHDGTVGMVMSLTGPNTYPSAVYSILSSGASNFSVINVAGAGVTSDNGFTCIPLVLNICRWGDYSAEQLDPATNNIWMATQYIPGAGDSTTNWGNRVFEVKG